jgi:hypothetical protein
MNDIVELQAQLREAINEEIESRIEAHRLSVSRINDGIERRKAHGLAPRLPQLDFLAIGDSWFDYPLNDYGVLWPNQDIVAKPQLQSMGSPPPKILSLAVHGQAMTAVMSWENQDRIVKVLKDSKQWLNGKTADAILVSGGGNDIAGDQFAIYVDYQGKGLNNARFQGVLDSIEASYMDLFALRDEVAPGVPIFAHCYDYAIPNGVHPGIFGGPWLQPPLQFSGYDYNEGLAIVKDAIDDFYKLLDKLAKVSKNNFVLVNTRGTLTRDSTHPLGWANELHPYTVGFAALAQKFLSSLKPKFPGRI